jgi:hypothetical protein
MVTFVVRNPVAGLQMSLEYRRHILFGLWSFNVPRNYTGYVIERAVANDPALAGGIVAM